MKKKILKIFVTGVIVTLISFIIFGFYGRKQIQEAGGAAGLLLDTDSLKNRLSFIALPDTAGEGSFANSMYMMNSSLSDSIQSSTSNWGNISLETRHAIIDQSGRLISSGSLAVVETKKCFNDEYKSCVDYNTSYALLNINEAFNEVQLQTLSEEMLQNKPALRIDSYYISDIICHPVKITILMADRPIYVFDCTLPENTDGMKLVEDFPLWIHEPANIDWKNAIEIKKKNELTEWCEDNFNEVFTETESSPESTPRSSISFNKYDISSFLGGPKIITSYSDGEYALLFLQQIECSSFLLTALLRAAGIGFGLALVILIATVIGRKKSKR